MHPSELRLGDIIFFNTLCDVPNHVAMYTGDIEGSPYITHSVINSDPGVHTTILKNIGRMDVFRPANPELAARAANLMLKWAKYRIPYDYRRANWMMDISNALKLIAKNKDQEEPIDYVLKLFEKEAKNKFYERIKFAARRDTCPIKILEGLRPRGFTCVQAIIIAFQIAEIEPFVKTLSELQKELAPLAETEEQLKEIWVSDKHCLDEYMFKYPLPESYVRYSAALRTQEEFSDFEFYNKRETPCHPHYYPSLVAWRYDLEPSIDDFINKFDSCLNLPSKFCFTDAMLAYMKKNTKHWANMGLLDHKVLPLTFSPEAKEMHKKRSSYLEFKVVSLREQISRERSLSTTSSPRGSSLNSDSYSSLSGFISPALSFYSANSASSATSNGFETPPKTLRRISSYSTDDGYLSSMAEHIEAYAQSTGTKSPLLDKMYSKKLNLTI